MNKLIVTGGAGFIGSNFVHYLLKTTQAQVIVVDKLTYAGSLHSLEPVEAHSRYQFVQADIADAQAMQALFKEHQPTGIINFAAESHVDRSIEGPEAFLTTNVVGVFTLLETTRHYLADKDAAFNKAFRFLQVSTDEVYGSLGTEGFFTETTAYAPNSPYAATKASADHLVRAYIHTYGLPAVVTNCSNNYGPYQFPEILIPLMILNALEGKSLPIYGDGGNIRDWLYVEDHCAAIWLVMNKGRIGEHYNIGGHNEKTNLDVVDTLCDILDELRPVVENDALKKLNVKRYSDLKTYVKDRPGHDRRYAIDADKIDKELGWRPAFTFEEGIRETVKWYLENVDWTRKVQEGNYTRQRLGLVKDE